MTPTSWLLFSYSPLFRLISGKSFCNWVVKVSLKLNEIHLEFKEIKSCTQRLQTGHHFVLCMFFYILKFGHYLLARWKSALKEKKNHQNIKFFMDEQMFMCLKKIVFYVPPGFTRKPLKAPVLNEDFFAI